MAVRAATYARYSTALQSADSLADQERICERIAERNGFTIVARFADAAISGGTAARPQYQGLLRVARRHEIDAVIAEDSSRLWRNMAEQAPRIAELADLGIHVVTQDLDTRQETAGVLGAVLGASSEAYRREIGRRTRRGLEGRALQGRPAGGRGYGYRASGGTREIDPERAKIVKEIFRKYSRGWSPKAIAHELNFRGVPSPGSTWKREQRRKGGWMASVIAGDPRRGIGILHNEMYRGRVIWNRLKWVRSAADSS
ncbi:MAG TPA: recombinase family protein, partial [Steroidobacteraceae bacterium]|nr:recombinase family protein [Steroidobacteraceae bacterium]